MLVKLRRTIRRSRSAVSQRGIWDLKDTALQFCRALSRCSVNSFSVHLPNEMNVSEGLVYFRVILGGDLDSTDISYVEYFVYFAL